MQNTVQFESRNIDSILRDFAVIGLTAEVIRSKTSRHRGIVVVPYERGRIACKLRDYLESHHCSISGGHIKTLPVDGWDSLLAAAVLH